MKTIGLIGGMSWQSTQTYYQIINEAVSKIKGGVHSAKIILFSVDFAEIEACQAKGDWDEAARLLCAAATSLEQAGADCLLICTNTMHLVYEQVAAAVAIPVLHIADATGERLLSDKLERVLLLGTAFTMQQPFYRQRLENCFGVQAIVPNVEDQDFIHQVIYQELCLGIIDSGSKSRFLEIIHCGVENQAQGVILGCTEIGLLICQPELSIPVYDTAQIHALAAVDYSL